MQSQTFVFIGRSGCGKGTQAKMLEEKLRALDSVRPIIHAETGKIFREFIQGEKYTHELAREISSQGGLQPEFLTVHMWAHYMIEHMTRDCHIIIDGTPRKYDEAHVLDTAFSFYKREKPFVLYLDIDREIVRQRLLSRGRADDNRDDIEARLNWFETEVVKAVDYFRTSPHYNFIRIDAGQDPQKVFTDILAATGLS